MIQEHHMGTISERKQKDGQVRYRAEIRMNKDGIKFSQSKIFSNKTLAKNWLKKRARNRPYIITKNRQKVHDFWRACHIVCRKCRRVVWMTILPLLLHPQSSVLHQNTPSAILSTIYIQDV